jgi:release factor glutamine methyltransferase
MELEPGHEILRAAAARLAAAGLDEPAREARLLARAARDTTEFEAFISRRATREPFAYIVGRREFWSLDFEVTRDVLIPRPDSETLVEAALKAFGQKPPQSIVDLGTGSGCLIVSLLTEWPGARGLAVDLSPAALNVARRNAARLGASGRLDFACADFATLEAGPFDLVVSNPPYIPSALIATLEPDVAAFEPGLALDGGADGLAAYRAIARVLPALLAPQGKAMLEIGWDQASAVTQVLQNQGFAVQPVIKDLAGNDRVLVAARPI